MKSRIIVLILAVTNIVTFAAAYSYKVKADANMELAEQQREIAEQQREIAMQNEAEAHRQVVQAREMQKEAEMKLANCK